MSVGDVIISVLVIGLTGFVAYIYNVIWLKPERLRGKLKQQGISGPLPSFWYGNIQDIKRIQLETAGLRPDHQHQDVANDLCHNYMSYVLPHLQRWNKEYGPVYSFMMGNMVIVSMADFETAKEFCLSKSTEFGRSSYLRSSRGALFGDSIVTAKGTSWAYQRKIVAPEFFMDKVKGMADIMIDSAISMSKLWEARIDQEEAGVACIRVDQDLKKLSAEIISKACFGSNYVKGNEIFERIVAIQDLISKQFAFLGLPGLRYIPTKNNRDIWRLDREIRNSVLKLMRSHELQDNNEDFLKALMESFCSNGSGKINTKKYNIPLIVDNCKAMFFAGHETTATAAAFTLVLLAYHQEWQKRVRNEVADICPGQVPNVDMLHKMKMLTMVIYETLRLYPAAPIMTRETSEDMKFGEFMIPKGVTIWLQVPALHQDPANWGANAGEFHPERFANGISSACKIPHLFMPFGTGIRTCVGQNFAMTELKIILSIILSKFTFSLSPNYRHQMAYKLVTATESGVYLQMERI